jgi:vitamin B12 transporter
MKGIAILLGFVIQASAQDTIVQQYILPTVEIKTNSTINDAINQNFNLEKSIQSGVFDLGNYLQRISPLVVNSYGAYGASATASIHGTSDDHSLVYWNGLKLNTTTLGVSDISLLPMQAFTHIKVMTMSQATYVGSGSFGGVLNLQQQPVFKDTAAIYLNAEIAQFHQYKISSGFLFANKKWNITSQLWYQNAQNNFKYKDIYQNNIKKESTNNALKNYGFSLQGALKIKQNQSLKISIWSQYKYKETPQIMGAAQPSSKNQEDKILRFATNYGAVKAGWNLNSLTGLSIDHLLYTDKLFPDDSTYFINSQINTLRFQQNVQVKRNIFNNMDILSGAEFNLNFVNTNNYNSKIINKEGAFWIALEGGIKKIKYNLSARQELSNFKYYRPVFALDILVPVIKSINFFVQFSDKYRRPDYNELYWNPGGNLNLNPEKGWGIESGFVHNYIYARNSSLRLKQNFYFINIKDNIVWQPISGIVWSPKNLKNTQHLGFDLENAYTYYRNKLNFSFILNYFYNRSITKKNIDFPEIEGNFLRYKPQHIIRFTNVFKYKFFFLQTYWQYMGKRFSDDENSNFFVLPPFHILDLDLGIELNKRNIEYLVSIYVKNATNTSYQIIRSYAQPSIQLGLNFKINFSNIKIKKTKHENN